MNKIYKVIWSKTKHCWVVVSEFAKSHTKGTSSKRTARGVAASLALAALISVAPFGMSTSYASWNLGYGDEGVSYTTTVNGETVKTVGLNQDGSITAGSGDFTVDKDGNVTTTGSITLGSGANQVKLSADNIVTKNGTVDTASYAKGIDASGQKYTRATGTEVSYGSNRNELSTVSGAQVVDTVKNTQYVSYDTTNDSTTITSKNTYNNGQPAGTLKVLKDGDVYISQQKDGQARTSTTISGDQVATGTVLAQTKNSGHVTNQVQIDGSGITFGKDAATAKKLTADNVVVQDDITGLKQAIGDDNSGLQKDVKDLKAKTAVITNDDTSHTTTIRNNGNDADYNSNVKISDKEVSTSTYQYDRANEAAETTSTTYSDGGVKTTASYVPGVGSKLEKVNTTGEVSVQNDGVSISQRTYDQSTYKTDTSQMAVNADGTTFSKTTDGTTKTTSINGDAVTTGTVATNTLTTANGSTSVSVSDIANTVDQTKGVVSGTGYSGTFPNVKSYSYTGLQEGNPNEDGSSVIAKGSGEGVAIITGNSKVNVTNTDGATFTKGNDTTNINGSTVTTGTLKSANGNGVAVSDIEAAVNAVNDKDSGLETKASQQAVNDIGDRVTTVENSTTELQNRTQALENKTQGVERGTGYSGDISNLKSYSYTGLREGNPNEDGSSVVAKGSGEGVALIAGNSKVNVTSDAGTTFTKDGKTTTIAGDTVNTGTVNADGIKLGDTTLNKDNVVTKNADGKLVADEATHATSADSADHAWYVNYNTYGDDGSVKTETLAGSVIHDTADAVLGKADPTTGQRQGGLVNQTNELENKAKDLEAAQQVTSESDLIKKDNTIGQNVTNVDTALHKEIAARIGADAAQDKVIQQVNENAAKGIATVNQAVYNEGLARDAADQNLQKNIDAVKDSAANKDLSNLSEAGQKVIQNTKVNNAANADLADRAYYVGYKDENGQWKDTSAAAIDKAVTAVGDENSGLIKKTNDLDTATKANAAAIDNERASREADVTNLQTNINKNTNAIEATRTAMNNGLDNEKQLREKADQNLQRNLNAETNARKADVGNLQNNINKNTNYIKAVADVENEHNALRKAETEANKAAIAQEVKDRQAADAAEAAARQAGDNGSLKLDENNVLQKQTVDANGNYKTENATEVKIGTGDNQVTINENGVKIGQNSTTYNKDGFYAGGDFSYDQAKAAVMSDGRIKGADGNFTVDKDGNVVAQNITGKDIKGDTLTTTGDATIGKDLDVKGDTKLEGNASVGKDLSVAGTTTTKDLKVTNDADIAGNATVGKDLSVKGNANVDGSFSAGNKQFQVQKDGSFKTTDSNGNNTFSVNSTTGEVLAHGNITSEGTIKGKEITDGAGASMTNGTVTGRTLSDGAGTTIASGKVTTNNVETDNLKVNNDASVGGDLNVTKDATIGGELSAGAGNFHVDKKGDVTTNGDIEGKNIKANGDVTATGTVQGSTITDGTAKLTGGNLTGVNNIEAKTITTTGDVKIGGKTTTDSLEVNKDATVNGDLTVKGKLNVGEIDMNHVGTDAATGNTYANHTNITADGISQKTSVTDNQGNKKESQFSKTADGTFNWASKDVAPGVVQKTTSNITADGTETTVQEGKDQKSTFSQKLDNISSGVQKDDNNKSSFQQKVDSILAEIHAGDNSTKVEQTATDVNTTAENGTISNKAKTITNESTGDTTNTVGGNLTNKVTGNQEDTIGGTKTTTVTGLTTENYNGGLNTNVTGTENHKVTGDKNETVTGAVTEEYGSQKTTVKGNQETTVGGNQTTTVTGDSSLNANNISNTATNTLANKAKDITNTADNDIVNKAGNKISNEALDIENTAKSSIKDTVANDYGSNVTTKIANSTTQELKNADGSKTATYLNGVEEQKATLKDGAKATTIDTIAGQTNTNITDGTYTSNDLQKADQKASSVADKSGNQTVQNQTATELAGSVTDGAKTNAYSNKADSFAQNIQDGNKVNAVAKNADQTVNLVTDGTNQTSTVQTATDLTNTAANGTITNNAKDLVNNITGNKTDNVTGAVTENYGSQTTTVANDQTTTVNGNQSNTVEKNQTNTVKGNKTETVDGAVTETYGSQDTTVKGDQKTTVNGFQTNTVEKDQTNNIKGSQINNITKDQTNTIGGNQTTTVTGDSSLTAENINNTAKNKITNKAIDIENSVTSSIKDTVANAEGENVTTKTSTQTQQDVKNLSNGKSASYLNGAEEQKAALTDGTQTTTIDTVAGQTNTNITDGTYTSNDLQKADQKASSVADKSGNQTVQNQTATELAGNVTDGTNSNGYSNKADSFAQTITDGTKTNAVAKTLDATLSNVTDGTNSTSQLQTAKDITNTAANGTISNTAKDITNTATGNITNTAKTGTMTNDVQDLVNLISGTKTETVDGTKTTTVKGLTTENYNGGLTTNVTGPENHTVTGDQTNHITGKQSNTVDGDQTNTIGGNQSTTVTGDSSLTAKNITNTATTQIQDKVGTTTVTTTDGSTVLHNEAGTHKTTMDYADVLKDLGVKGNAIIDGNTSVGKDLSVDGNTTLGKAGENTTLTVNSVSTFNEAATFNKGVTVNGGTTTDTLHVTGESQLDGDVTMGGNANVAKNLNVGGDANVAGDVTANSYKVGDKTYIDKDGLNANNQIIRNVAPGQIAENSKDVVVGSQLHETNQRVSTVEHRVDNLDHRVSEMDGRIDKVGANAAAMANLHPMEYDPDTKLSMAAAVGNYGSETAGALGIFYRPSERVMLNASASFGNDENMVGGGVSFALGHIDKTPKADPNETAVLKDQVNNLQSRLDAMLSVLNPNMSKDFPDVPENHWAYEAVSKLAGNGLIEGYEDGNFHGERQMTRYEMAEIIYNALAKGAKAEQKLVEEFKPELQAMAAQRKA